MAQGPPVPAYVLRGHEAAVHILRFYQDNSLLVSGDSSGWIVIWSLLTKRPVAVWKGHDGGVLQIQTWTVNRLVSHGRDHKLRVWQVRPEDLANLSTQLPSQLKQEGPSHPQPWLVHSLDANALNFCSFSMCAEKHEAGATDGADPQLIASPNGLDTGGVDIFQLPSEKRISQIQSDQASPAGMVMALSLLHDTQSSTKARLLLVAGYEDGHVAIFACTTSPTTPQLNWDKLSITKAHTQPVLSLAVLPSLTHVLTSSADATIASIAVPSELVSKVSEDKPSKAFNTKHAGQQDLKVRSDSKVFCTAGWDGRVRVYSCKTMKELAVLSWHKVGCYSTAFAKIRPDERSEDQAMTKRMHAPIAASTISISNLAKPVDSLDLIKQEREGKARNTHWLAAGGKDGKISLWDIY